MAIARCPTVVIDCPEARPLAEFYAALLGWEVHDADDGADDWLTIAPADGRSCLCVQQVEDYRAPEWPGQHRPQQMHLDVDVDDLDAGERAVLELGATKHPVQPGETFRVFLDPAGHPFCLCQG